MMIVKVLPCEFCALVQMFDFNLAFAHFVA